MEKLKQGLLVGSILGMVLLIVFVPGMLLEQKDKEQIGEIHVEQVSAGRNALLTALSLEERIELCSSSAAMPVMLFEMGISSSSGITSDEGTKVSLEYSYQIEEKEVFESFRSEIEKLVTEGVVPGIIQPKETAGIGGLRFYLYSEEKDYGAVFSCMELVTKSGLLARFIVDEESGKMIAYYLSGEEVDKIKDSLQEYGKPYLSYLDLEYDLLESTKWEQVYQIGEDSDFYYFYADWYHWMVYPA